MKVFGVVLVLLLFVSIPSYAQTPTAGPNSNIGWDQAAASTTEAAGFTYKYYPSGAGAGTTFTTPIVCTGSVSPYQCQTKFPTFPNGPGSFSMTAANAGGTSLQSPLFSFSYTTQTPPPTPSNLRILNPTP